MMNKYGGGAGEKYNLEAFYYSHNKTNLWKQCCASRSAQICSSSVDPHSLNETDPVTDPGSKNHGKFT